MCKIALISFLNHSINVRALASHVRRSGHEAICIFVLAQPDGSVSRNLVDFLDKRGIQLAGLSLVTDDYLAAARLTDDIKASLKIPVIWGGAHVNVMPEECLAHADMICMGEGEEALCELLQNSDGDLYSNTTVKNIWYRTDKGIVRNGLRPLEENLDKYACPENDRDFLFILSEKGLEKFSEGHLGGVYNVMTSRGCPYQCDYCYNSYRKNQYRGLGRYLRMRSVENVIDELKLALSLFPGLRYIQFWDDCFTARTTEELARFKELYNQHVRLPFFALIEPMIFDYEKIRLLKECGLRRLQVGIQTGSERVNRDVYNRKASNTKVLQTAHYINRLGIEVVYDLIFNNPYETSEDLRQTIEMLSRFPRPFQVQGYNLIYYPGTRITERALADGFISPNNGSGSTVPIQSKDNSPISMRGTGRISSRFYSINYSSEEKLYWNTVISLLASNYIPRSIVRFFGRSEGPVKKVLLKMFVRAYAAAASAKLRLTSLGR